MEVIDDLYLSFLEILSLSIIQNHLLFWDIEYFKKLLIFNINGFVNDIV